MNDAIRGAAAPTDWQPLATAIGGWGRALGFDDIAVADTDLGADEARLLDWLAAGRHGAMDYMARHGRTRARPAALVPGTLRVITARMNYLPPGARAPAAVLADPAKGYVARYALGRDYHKLLRRRLAQLVLRIRAPPTATRSGCSPTARRCSRWRSRPRPGWGGAASTRCC